MKKTIVLTGGANGIGRALAETLSQEHELFVIDRDQEAGKQVEAKCHQPNLHFFYGDLGREEDLADFVTLIQKHAHKIDGIIHDAAIDKGGLIDGADYQAFVETMKVNVASVYYLVKELQPLFSDKMSVILFSSTRNRQSMANNESYSASKGALLSLTHAMANSLRSKARVNVITPGWIDTTAYQRVSEPQNLSESDHSQHLVGRVGNPHDIVTMAEFLLDENKSGFITGQEFVVDGGMSKQMIYHDDHGWNYRSKRGFD